MPARDDKGRLAVALLSTAGVVFLAALGPSPGASAEVAPSEAAPAPPWRQRVRRDLGVYRREQVRIGPSDWAAEPVAPAGEIDRTRFAAAVRQLCGRMRESRAAELGGLILDNAAAFDVDPFLLGGLVHQQSHCKRNEERHGGVGLTHLPWRAHVRDLRRGTYRYWVLRDTNWVEVSETLDRFPFTGAQLRRADPNLYFAAGILKVLRTQHHSIHQAFPDQTPHRHYVSHFVWGDQVRGSRAEDRILSERRRLLQYYGAYTPPDPLRFRGMEIAAPLDGAPRVIMSWLGARRDAEGGGRRPHRGTDVESYPDEPVRAVADGRVVVAGVDLPGAAHEDSLTWRQIMRIERSELGPGGRYVCLQHDPPDGARFRTCYMHLERVWVRRGQTIARGDRLGTVGRTGIRNSAAHLHFEMRDPNERLDPSVILAGHLVGHRPRRRSYW